MYFLFTSLALLATLTSLDAQKCPDYLDYSKQYHTPFSTGRYNLSYQRPAPECRTFVLPEVESTITRLKSKIQDPDVFRLFENSFPNTLDTAVKWKGYANGTDKELTFLITGDINAMWLRDSANQMQSYLPLLKPSSLPDSLASLYRGVINLQARYLLTSPYCNSFQPPVESKIPPSANSAARNDVVKPPYNNQSVFECKYELDSLAAFLEISTNYYQATNDTAFFGKYQWVNAIKAALSVAEAMMTPTYAANGSVNSSPYTFTRLTNRATETLANDGIGNPVQGGTDLIRSAFRPSDDATIYQFLIPSNLMFANYLSTTSNIMSQLANQKPLADRMSSLASSLQKAISTHGTFVHPTHGRIYAFEVDGYGSVNAMDDANIPSLLSSPISGGIKATDSTYQATRRVLLSAENPYFMRGPVINSIGGPHNGPGLAWPMASIVRILTSSSEDEIVSTLKEIVSSTDGLGLIHESVNSFDQTKWTRQWFSWANGLFGQMVLDLEGRMAEVLGRSYQ